MLKKSTYAAKLFSPKFATIASYMVYVCIQQFAKDIVTLGVVL